jgi:hypothetical protein
MRFCRHAWEDILQPAGPAQGAQGLQAFFDRQALFDDAPDDRGITGCLKRPAQLTDLSGLQQEIDSGIDT